jgi:photosystem II stability/assembly factor-like uncharacterized protein
VSGFDPVDDWLGTDVELLHPRPGSFERVHRQARRRKTMMAATTAVGAAVVIAAAVAVPQLAGSFLPGHNSPTTRILTSQSPRPNQTKPGKHPGRAKDTGPVSVSPPGGTATISGSSYQPAAGFEPTSVTFISGTVGAALGQTTSCRRGSCTVLAGTSDYGQSWYAIDAPPAGPPDGGTGVSQVRFLNQNDGFAYGPELYSTTDGGATWSKVTGLPGRVIDLSTIDGEAFAVTSICTGTGADFAAHCTGFTLFSSPATSPAGSNSWKPVAGASDKYPVSPGALQFSGTNGYVLAPNGIYSGAPGGGGWNKVTVRSGTVPACLQGQNLDATPGETGLLAPTSSGQGLYLLCQPPGEARPTLYESASGGRTWRVASQASIGGRITSLALATSSNVVVVATTSGLYYSPDGRTWHRAATGSFSFVGMTDQQQGVAVPADPSARGIYVTQNAGRSWTAHSI